MRLLEGICLSKPRQKEAGPNSAEPSARRAFQPLKRSTANPHPAIGVRAPLDRSQIPLRTGPLATFGHRRIRIVIGHSVTRPGLAGEVPAADCTSSALIGPGPWLKKNTKSPLRACRCGFRVPRATEHLTARPRENLRTSVRRRNFVQYAELRGAEAISGRPARSGAPVQHGTRSP